MTTQEQREIDYTIEEVAIKAMRRESLLQQRLGNLERELIEQRADNRFKDNMIGVVFIVMVVATIIF
tara:strand:- start:220 stop:420 length:201 start_codon:yes stop_codon:yes gene_type:complete